MRRSVRQQMSEAMRDVKHGKRLYCYLERARASASIKRMMRRAFRRTLKVASDD